LRVRGVERRRSARTAVRLYTVATLDATARSSAAESTATRPASAAAAAAAYSAATACAAHPRIQRSHGFVLHDDNLKADQHSVTVSGWHRHAHT
tara:strand:+ start:266 stop:547 length:282 start_codon:yes stop_codon:yes gene_type:complete